MLKKVENFCLMHNLIKNNECLLIACSGGPDSIALADIFRQLSNKYKLKIHIAHAEHGIRKDSSLADAKYVENYCKKYNLPFHLQHLNVPEFAQKQKLSTETAARFLRYQFLRNTAKNIGAKKILTAHHLNDQAETMLQHLMRGAGMDGLSGMKIINKDIIRPFLCVYREEIEAYCERNNLQPRFDETNTSLDYERNKIRWELLPQMQKYNPQVIEAICRSASIIAEENDFFKSHVQKVYNSLCTFDNNIVILSIAQLKNEHSAVRKALYRLILHKIYGSLDNISFLHIDKIDRFIYNGHTGSILQLPHDLRVSINYDKLKIFKVNKEGNSQSLEEYSISVDINSSVSLPNGNILSINQTKLTSVSGRNDCLIDADKISGKLFIRNRRNGDKIIPKGMQGSKKLKDIFIDKKIPANQRNNIALLCDEKGIIWIAGIQQNAEYVPDKNSKNILHLNLQMNLQKL